MNTEITLTIPERLYRRVQKLARWQRTGVTDTLDKAISLAEANIERQAFPAVYVHPRRAEMEKEQATFWAMQEELLAQHKGEFVAVFQGKVVDHDPDQDRLVARIDERYPDEIVLIKQVTGEPDRVIYMRSPRFVK